MMTTLSQRQEWMEEGQALVHSLAAKIHRIIPVRIDLDDLIAYGEVGLAEAARSFDPERGSQFITFAYYRVRGAIYDGLSKMSWTSRAYARRYRYERLAQEALEQDEEDHRPHEGRSLTEEATWFRGVTEKLACVFLVSHECDTGRGDSVFEDPHESAATLVARQEISNKLRQLVSRLPEIEQRLINTVYFEGATIQHAAVRLSISKSWASRLHARALEKLARDLRQLDGRETPHARVR